MPVPVYYIIYYGSRVLCVIMVCVVCCAREAKAQASTSTTTEPNHSCLPCPRLHRNEFTLFAGPRASERVNSDICKKKTTTTTRDANILLADRKCRAVINLTHAHALCDFVRDKL